MGSSNNKISPHDVKFPPYTPPSSLGHELGILFAFLSLCVITMGLYWFFWQASQRRTTAKEEARREALAERLREKEAEERRNALSLNPNRTSGGSSFNPSVHSTTHRLPAARNGTSAAGFGFGDTEENMVM